MGDVGGDEEFVERAPMKMPKKATKVRNKAPANTQITAEQLLREAKERELEKIPPPPRQQITDPEELAQYRVKKRKEFEDNIRKNRTLVPNWVKYARWEESQSEVQRSRSVFERGLDMDHRSITLWLQYAEMEMRNKQVNHARNIWDRAATILPRVTQFWLKYSYMEEMIGNIPGARQVFERWMEWEPSEQAWMTYINFELRYKEVERARKIWQRYLHVHHEVRNWIRYAKFEQRNGEAGNARQIFERAVEFFGDEHAEEKLLVAFAKFEEAHKEHERARVIYRYGLDRLPADRRAELFKQYTVHEKKYGERAGIETVIVSKRRQQYEKQVAESAFNYDAWFDYVRLLEHEGNDVDGTRELYERAIANVPPKEEKRLWRRYIYLWINYALFEELTCKDAERTRQVYNACLDVIPHKKFTFAKIWVMFAHFELRQKRLDVARKIMGTAIGKCPKEKLYRCYIDMELQLRCFDRCRLLYEKCLQSAPANCAVWIKFAELETLLGDLDRARAIFDLAIGQSQLDMPELLWKSYIDFEIGCEDWPRARNLYRKLLQRTQHVKVWLSYAKFELNCGGKSGKAVQRARDIFVKGNRAIRSSENKEERLMLLEAWMMFERELGDEATLAAAQKEMPRRVKKRRPIVNEQGFEAGWEEYFDYIFPSDESTQTSMKLLQLAQKWKKTRAAAADAPAADADAAAENAPAGGGSEEAAAGGEQQRQGEQPEEGEGREREGDSDTDMGESTSSSASDSDSDDSDDGDGDKTKDGGADGGGKDARAEEPHGDGAMDVDGEGKEERAKEPRRADGDG